KCRSFNRSARQLSGSAVSSRQWHAVAVGAKRPPGTGTAAAHCAAGRTSLMRLRENTSLYFQLPGGRFPPTSTADSALATYRDHRSNSCFPAKPLRSVGVAADVSRGWPAVPSDAEDAAKAFAELLLIFGFVGGNEDGVVAREGA